MQKIYRKSLLAVMVAAAVPLLVSAAEDNIIYVTTTADENDSRPNSTCSLREAVIAAKTNKAYGGCIAGQQSLTDQIKFKNPGVYTLTKPLIIDSTLVISGANAFSYDTTDAVNNTEAARTQLNTIIKGDGSFSLLDSSTSRNAISLNNLVLQNGGGIYGGAIRSGGAVSLNRVYILNSEASKSGGAIYLEGSASSLSATDSLFYQNTTKKRGAVLGMSCIDNLSWTPRTINFDRTSIIYNGSAASESIIDYCGTPSGSINASTIAENTVSGTLADSAVIRYKHDTGNIYPLHPNSTISLTSNTIVKNHGSSTLLYDNVGSLLSVYNVIAFNTGGKSCRYFPGTKLEAGNSKVAFAYDAMFVDKQDASTNGIDGLCYVPELAKDATDTREIEDIINSKDNFSSLFYNLPLFSPDLVDETNITGDNAEDIQNKKDIIQKKNAILRNYGFLPAYIPKTGTKLVESEGFGCSTYDQRGSTRNIRVESQKPNSCDKGSIEISKLFAANASIVSNASVADRISDLEFDIKLYEDELAKPDVEPLRIKQYELTLADMKQQLNSLQIINPNNRLTQRYRQVYVPVLSASIEQEIDSNPVDDAGKLGTGIKYYKFLNEKGQFNDSEDSGYKVSVRALGRGSLSFIDSPTDSTKIDTTQKKYITCVWNPALREIMVSRLELDENNKPLAVTTPAGSAEYCAYTISLRSNPQIKSTGYIQAQIINIAPIAKDDSYTLKYGSTAPLAMDLLANDSDDGDGATNLPGYPSTRNVFYADEATNTRANIKISGAKNTSTGVETDLGIITFEFVQPCPNSSTTTEDETCYGGKMTYLAKNVYSPFNDSFKYRVLDADKQESNEATVKIVNTATTTDDTRGNSGSSTGTSGGGGGGSIGWLAIAGLGLLTAVRRRLVK